MYGLSSHFIRTSFAFFFVSCFQPHCCVLAFRTNVPFHTSSLDRLSIAQLVERRTVVGYTKQRSLGHWFKSGSREVFLFKNHFQAEGGTVGRKENLLSQQK